jgi:hypothetical protein
MFSQKALWKVLALVLVLSLVLSSCTTPAAPLSPRSLLLQAAAAPAEHPLPRLHRLPKNPRLNLPHLVWRSKHRYLIPIPLSSSWAVPRSTGSRSARS